jgi:hypothetical protein
MPDQAPLIPSRIKEGDPTWDFCSADQMGIYAVMNTMFETAPELFGNETTQRQIQEDIHGLIAANFTHLELMGEIGLVFRRYNINPFADISLCFIGADRIRDWSQYPRDGLIRTEETAPLIDMFGQVTIFNAANDPAQRFDLDTYERLTQGQKFDFVLTGNVLNDPKVTVPLTIFAACSNALKKKGHAIHLTEYGSNFPGATNLGEQYTMNAALNFFLDQPIIGKEEMYMQALNGATKWCELHFSIAQKTRESVVSVARVQWYDDNIGANTPWDKIDPVGRYLAINNEILDEFEGNIPPIETFYEKLDLIRTAAEQDDILVDMNYDVLGY